jgi:hypothetical protein
MPEKAVTTMDVIHLFRFMAQQEEKAKEEMRKIRRENGWQSADAFLAEVEAAKFDPRKAYPWEKKTETR